ncbi:MAG: hypothetical protein KDD55_05115 [Bdellovibrionales bacterium]|nr:hypothetical protein [Bdellovibrionales bacterium]
MHIKLQSFQCSLRKGFPHIAKEAQAWFDEHQYITLQESKLSVVGDTIVYVILYTEEESYSYQGSSSHYAQATQEPLSSSIESRESHNHISEERELEPQKPFKLGEQNHFKKGLSINHLFKE